MQLAEKEADYFFEHYKSKKKREVFGVPSYVVYSGMADPTTLDPTEDSLVTVSQTQYSWYCKIRQALREGKSVRLKK